MISTESWFVIITTILMLGLIAAQALMAFKHWWKNDSGFGLATFIISAGIFIMLSTMLFTIRW